jgi:hypothetical protein
MKIIWSACHTDGFHEEHLRRVIDRAAEERVAGVEISGRGIDDYVEYRSFPALQREVNPRRLEERRQALRRVCEQARKSGLTLGIWHHEIWGPDNLLDLLPDLRANDGLINLESPVLYQYLAAKCREFFELFPEVGELVLTLTETKYVVAHRPFSPTPPDERIRRVLEAIASITGPLGKQLVIRPFSALRADELNVRNAIERLGAQRVSVMYKTEPFDWNPFLPDEPLIGSIPDHEARAETDAGAEYYGQAAVAVSYTGHIEKRLTSARQKGAAVAVLRVDRGHTQPALGHPLNEVNVIAPTRWLREPTRPLSQYWEEWFQQRHGFRSPALRPLLERTFEVIQKSLYIDGQSLTHNAFPDLSHAKHIQVFALFEQRVPLSHLQEHWSMLPERSTLSHAEILAEKAEAERLAGEIIDSFERLTPGMNPSSRRALLDSLQRLRLLAEACTCLCRLLAAHTEEVGRCETRTTEPFEAERHRLLALADKVENAAGPDFFRRMPHRMRDVAKGLAAERELELPLRRSIEAEPGMVDYVLCGFASEGHRLAKRLHTGATFRFADRYVRATGIGPDEGFTYHLRPMPAQMHRLVVTLAGDGQSAPGRIRIGAAEHSLETAEIHGLKDFAFPVPPWNEKELPVRVWSTSAQPCRVATIRLLRA